MISRRAMLLGGGLSVATLSGLHISGRALAAPDTGTKVMVVFLRGAYDATSIVIPTSSDFYYQSRPTIAIARPDPGNAKAALPLDADWSLHPALSDSLYPLWQAGQLAFVPFAGTDDTSRSHFETQDSIEMGQPLTGARDYKSGFLGRIATALGNHVQPIAFSQDVPIIFRGGDTPVPNLAVNSIGKPAFDQRQQGLIEAMYNTPQAAQIAPLAGVHTGFSVRQQAYTAMQQEMTAASRGAVDATGFSLQAQRIAELMRSGYNLAFLDVGGWDTHVNQGNADGQLAAKITDLGRGLASFVKSSGSDWDHTTVIVISEFGRTFRENGDKGTDHGHGSVYWVMGGSVRGGRIVGPQVKIAADTLFQKRDLPVLTDYRALIGGMIQPLYGFNATTMDTIFAGVKPVNLNLL
ncbi:DUF1501 domain-containing protein [Asticcacaulis sp. 201]|uniref:DUF1501 domain-containing protein n=1 Tax=Asticcacaulis sp. 201 TaxID=3028787 RepID=UPI00291673C1|nr:DUF1501 domain-containing protein [Asticcacaulis sp. 201]MDV6329538.1 DUF1501 domain-containing protein [Asticcacaulis sp. 201]